MEKAFRLLGRSKSAVFGLAVILAVVLVAAAAPWLAPHSYREQFDEVLAPPLTPGFPLGTDELGRDVLSRMMWGARTSLAVGLVATGVSAFLGVFAGLLAGYYGGWWDELANRVMDVMRGVPVLLLALVLVTLFGPGPASGVTALALVWWTTFGRLVRGQVLSLKHWEFVEAARALGVPDRLIIWRHIFPNVLPVVIVTSALTMGTAIIVEAALSFLGVGVRPPFPSWGGMLATARMVMYQAPWLSIFPGMAIALTVLGFNLVGDGLRAGVDPRLAGYRPDQR